MERLEGDYEALHQEEQKLHQGRSFGHAGLIGSLTIFRVPHQFIEISSTEEDIKQTQQKIQALNQRNECLEKNLHDLKGAEEMAENALDDSRNQVALQRSLSEAASKSFEQSLVKAHQAVADVKSECKRNLDDIGKLLFKFEMIRLHAVFMP